MGMDAVDIPGAHSDASDNAAAASIDGEGDLVSDDDDIAQASSKIIKTPPHRVRHSKNYVDDIVEVAASVDSESDIAPDDNGSRASSEIINAPPYHIKNRELRSPSEDSEASETISNIIEHNSPAIIGAIPIMDHALQDHDAYSMYENLPYLQNVCEVVPYGSGPPMENHANLAFIRQAVSKRTLDLILMGMLFVNNGCYVNTARIEPNKLAVATATNAADSIKLQLTLSARTNENAVGIMIGMVTECFLVEEYTSISNEKPFSFHKITISPFAQEYRRDVALWGQMLNFRTIVGSVSAQGLSFTTRRKTAYTSTFSSPHTPQKPNKFLMTVSNPLTPCAGSSNNRGSGGYPTSRRFDEKVLIYDGRAKTARPFTFTPDDFSKLATWPIYKEGHADLPQNSLVTVGYTLNLYSWPSGSDNSQLSTNVHFVILLGVPVDA
ncbi:hypothetical protein BD779DRAFT_1674939 [Infundibulicybe gibba]|nr:hypothetical protein BD779DRAFT_1674939 [Infundibulicybe gibba]